MSSPASVEADERLRLFVALQLPPEVAQAIADWQEQYLSQGRLTRLEDLHITLAFLGSRPATEVPTIAAQLRAAAGLATRPILSVVRYRETPRVGMLALEDKRPGATHAVAVAYDIQERMGRLGIPLRERSPWRPHVTVMRFRERPRLDPPLLELEPFSPSDAALYHSVLRPTGAQYEILESAALGG